MTFEKLKNEGNKIAQTEEGTVLLYELDSIEYVVLQDNTVITRKEDNESEDAFFPY